MQQKNDYNKEVFNGDLGTVFDIDRLEKKVIIQFDGRDVSYDYADLNEITLAWATSIHKSQGSEYPVVILPLYTQHYVMLSRNLFYTGLTRAKQKRNYCRFSKSYYHCHQPTQAPRALHSPTAENHW